MGFLGLKYLSLISNSKLTILKKFLRIKYFCYGRAGSKIYFFGEKKIKLISIKLLFFKTLLVYLYFFIWFLKLASSQLKLSNPYSD